MRRFAGQAARHCGRAVHAILQIALALVVAAAVAVGAAAWRLSRGPVELTSLVPMLQAAANTDPALHVTLGRAAIAWEGFRAGLDQPLDIRVTDVALSNAAGRRLLSVPGAALTLSPLALLRGRLVPRAVELDGLRLHAIRHADGSVAIDLPGMMTPGGGPGPDLPQLLRTLAAPPRTDRSAGRNGPWSQLRRVRLRDGTVTVTDEQLGTGWALRALTLDLRRPAAGGIAARAATELDVGAFATQVAADARVAPDARRINLHAATAAIAPPALAAALKPAAALAAVEAPVTLSGGVELRADFALTQATLTATLGAGALHVGRGLLPVVAAQATLRGTPEHAVLDLARFVTAPRPDGPRTTITGHAELTRSAAGIAADAALDLDAVAFADLPSIWPAGFGGPGTRPWIVQNITDGTAHDFHVELALSAPPDLSDVTLTRLDGGGDGSDLTVHWLRPVPPIVHGEARLNFLGPDALEVVATAGQEVIGSTVTTIRGGRVLFTALEEKDQYAEIDADLAGSVPGALALLAQKRIGLLARSPLQVQDAGGQFAGRIAVTHLPLRDDVKMDDVQIRAALQLTGVHLPAIVAGRDLDNGTLDLTADPEGLQAAGQATLAGIGAAVQARMDFRAGPGTQVLESVTASGPVTAAQLASLGLPAAPYATGTAQVQAQVDMRRNHTGTAAVRADLAGMALAFEPLGWRKPAGTPAQAAAQVALDHDRIAVLDALTAGGGGLQLAAAASFVAGRPDTLQVTRLRLGPATDLSGTVHVPNGNGGAWRADLAGPSLDLTAYAARQPGPRKPQTAGPPYAVDLRFDRVVLGPGRALQAVAAHAESDGQVLRRASVAGETAGAHPFSFQIDPVPGGRRLQASAADAGGLLRALDIVPDMQGGRLTLAGRYDDTVPGRPLTARAEIDAFRIRDAPGLARLLKAMTLYGLVDLVQGPGLGFTRLIAPFRLVDQQLELQDARAFSPSLGMTAKGRLDLVRRAFDMQGTIVPAYFFNSLLGDIPVLGRLFSPERGGGVFAATYTLRGPLRDPQVSVNPLAALTPGFLRGLFGAGTDAAPLRGSGGGAAR